MTKMFLLCGLLLFCADMRAQEKPIDKLIRTDFSEQIKFPVENIKQKKGEVVLVAFGKNAVGDTAIILSDGDPLFKSAVQQAIAYFFTKNKNTQYFDTAFVQPVIFVYSEDVKKVENQRIIMPLNSYQKLFSTFDRKNAPIRKSVIIPGYD